MRRRGRGTLHNHRGDSMKDTMPKDAAIVLAAFWAIAIIAAIAVLYTS